MYPQQGSIVHSLFGQVRLTSRLYDNTLIYNAKTRDCPNITLWEKDLVAYTPKTSHTLMLPVGSRKCKDVETGESIIQLTFPAFLYQLNQESINRSTLKQPFLETELMYILYTLVEASKLAQDLNLRIGAICPHTVLLNEFGFIRIFCQLSSPDYQKLMYRKWLRPSPEELRDPNSHLPAKSQAFSIAITILESGLLVDVCNIYKDKYVMWEDLTEHFKKFKSLYSESLAKLLMMMADPDLNLRPSPAEILAILAPYEDLIKAMTPIQLDFEKCKESLIRFLSKNQINRN